MNLNLCAPLKDGLRGQHFPHNDAVVAAVKKWTTSADAVFYERSIKALVHRWQKCIKSEGNYVEKLTLKMTRLSLRPMLRCSHN